MIRQSLMQHELNLSSVKVRHRNEQTIEELSSSLIHTSDNPVTGKYLKTSHTKTNDLLRKQLTNFLTKKGTQFPVKQMYQL